MGDRKWEELIADRSGPWQMRIGDGDAGAVLPGKAPYPDLTVRKELLSEVDRLVYHTMEVEASADFTERRERYMIGRLVAILKSGHEVEFEREVLPSAAIEGNVDTRRCAACSRQIPAGEAKVVDGDAYHAACIEEE